MERTFMKTTIALLSGIVIGSSTFVPQSFAGDREWATAGKVFTGIFAAHAISRILEPPVYVAPAPVVVQQPVYVQPTPVVVQTVQTVQPTPVVQTQTVQTTVPVIPNAPTVAPAPVAPAAPMVPATATTTTTTTSYVVQQPVYVQPTPVYVSSPPVYVTPVYAPPPVFSIGFGFGRYHGCGPGVGFHHGYRGRHGW